MSNANARPARQTAKNSLADLVTSLLRGLTRVGSPSLRVNTEQFGTFVSPLRRINRISTRFGVSVCSARFAAAVHASHMAARGEPEFSDHSPRLTVGALWPESDECSSTYADVKQCDK